MAEAIAPGKLVICGEYAVLEGAPAIAVAVDVAARARVSAADACRLGVAGDGDWCFRWDASGLPRWLDTPPAGQGRVLDAVSATLAAAGLVQASRLEIRLDTLAFQRRDTGGVSQKLGLGSSAAITVALTAALLARGGDADRQRPALLDLCTAAHRRLQGGSGSGIDVATAVHGGVVTRAGTAGAVRTLVWPTGLHWLAAWSGTGASTTALLARMHQFRQAQAQCYQRLMSPLRAAAAAALAAWERAGADELLAALAHHQDCLRELDAAAGIGIWTAGHQRLCETATAAGAFYKTSGAGGGDFGLAFATSAEVIDAPGSSIRDAGRTHPRRPR